MGTDAGRGVGCGLETRPPGVSTHMCQRMSAKASELRGVCQVAPPRGRRGTGICGRPCCGGAGRWEEMCSCGAPPPPPHLNVHGNDGADAVVLMGRQSHPYNLLPLSKRRWVPDWDQLGLEQGCIRKEGTSEAAPEAVGQAVGGGCRTGWGRLLSVTNAIEAGTWLSGVQWLGIGWVPWKGGRGLPPFQCIPGLERMAECRPLPDPDGAGVESSEDEGMGSFPSSESDGAGVSTDVSDRARERAQEGRSPAVRETDDSADVSDNRQRKGRRVIQGNPDVAQRHHSGPKPNPCRRLTAPRWTSSTMCGGACWRLAERSGQRVSRLRRVILDVPLECRSDSGGCRPSFYGQARACPMNAPVRAVFLEDFIVRWTCGGGGGIENVLHIFVQAAGRVPQPPFQ